MKVKILAAILILVVLFTGCKRGSDTNGAGNTEVPGETADLGDDSKVFGGSLEDLGVYDGYFEGESTDITVKCESGTKNAYKLEGSTLTFTAIGEESVYSVSGKFSGNIVIDVGDNYKFDLELSGLSLVSNSINPIMVLSGDEVSIQAKSGCSNYIYDIRPALDQENEDLFSGAIHSDVDLEIAGKGSLTVVSENNNGIHSKDDLQVKNLTLSVVCVDNALKGNDSVEITDGSTTLIASGGDGVKTVNSDISEKGNQRGNISIAGGTHTIYAACDGIDAAHSVTVDGSATVLNIYTDKYSSYSDEVTAVSSSEYYIRYTSKNYSYSIKFINSESGAYEWVNAEYHSQAIGGRSAYYYYSFPKLSGYDKIQFFVYSSDMKLQQEEDYAAASDQITLNSSYDTIALTSSGYSWTNYTTTPQGGGMGGMQDGNTDKGDYSTKGIKAANEIVINAGEVNVKSYDDAVHANKDTALENGVTPLGNVTVNGGTVNVYSNDDGLHADGTLSINSGTVNITNSYEGIEGMNVNISGGYVSIISKDDGINGTATSGVAISIGGGSVYIYCSGDGIDSNSRTQYSGILFSGGYTVVITTSGGNSAIDTEQGYEYTGGCVVAVMPRGGMSSEATHCSDFSSVGKSASVSLSAGEYLVVGIGDVTATVEMPVSLSAYVIVLGDKSPNVDSKDSVSVSLDGNGVCWN